jgi:hypothetical protein
VEAQSWERSLGSEPDPDSNGARMQELSPRGQIDGSRRVCEDVAVLRGLISSTYYLKFELQIRERERGVSGGRRTVS